MMEYKFFTPQQKNMIESSVFEWGLAYLLFQPIFAPLLPQSFNTVLIFFILVVISGTSSKSGAWLRHPLIFYYLWYTKFQYWPSGRSKGRDELYRFLLTYKVKRGLFRLLKDTIKFAIFTVFFFNCFYSLLFTKYFWFHDITGFTHVIVPEFIKICSMCIHYVAYLPIIFLFDFSYFVEWCFSPAGQQYLIPYFIQIWYLFIDFLRSLSVILPLLLGVAFLTLYERKVLASVQLRRGPDVTGFAGLLQPIADGFKLLLKELTIPLSSNKTVFILAPMLTFFFAFFGVLIFPFYTFDIVFDFELSMMLFFGLSSIGIFGIILSGWASNSRYAFLGSLRSTAQIISYEVSLGLTLLTVCLPVSSLAFSDIVMYQVHHGWFIFPFFFTFVLFVISSLAEVNRPPFDLPEAEAELVSGYNVEYSSATFALFFIGEYANIIVTSLVSVFFFFGGAGISTYAPLVLAFKLIFFLTFFILIRAALPRFRYDQLITFGWKGILPISFGWFVFTAAIFYALNALSFFFCYSTFTKKSFNFSSSSLNFHFF